MPIPDFDQIARQLVDGILEQAGKDFVRPDPDSAGRVRAGVAEQLRQVWNARGAADDKAVTIRSMEMLGTSGGGVYAGHYSKTIKALDR